MKFTVTSPATRVQNVEVAEIKLVVCSKKDLPESWMFALSESVSQKITCKSAILKILPELSQIQRFQDITIWY